MKMRMFLPAALTAVVAAAVLTTGAGVASAATTGVNDYSCKPSTTHPDPVVLVHGLLATQGSWSTFAPKLAAQGYCVFSLDYGDLGTADIAASAGHLSTFIAKVLSSTGAKKTEIVAHSEGGVVARYYLKNLGGGPKTDKLVGLAPANYGTTLDGIASLFAGSNNPAREVIRLACTACAQLIQGSNFLTTLNSPSDTVPGVSYTVIESTKDSIITPYTNTFLKSAGVTNELTQTFCPADAASHTGLQSDPNAWQLVYNALDPSSAKAVTCTAYTS